MKKIFFLQVACILLANSIRGQTFILLDRNWSKSAVLTDSVTHDDLSKGLYPIYSKELDTLIVLVDKLKNLKSDGLKRKFFYSEDFKTSHLEFIIENIKRTYGDGYEINLISKGSFGQNTLKLADPRLLLPKNEKIIRNFLSYLIKTKKYLNR